jgi:hypothetical protein
VAPCISLPVALPFDAATWEQTPRVVCQLAVQLLAMIRQQEARIMTLEARIAALEARLQQRSRNSNHRPSSDPPYKKGPANSGAPGRPGAKPRHPEHRQVLLAPTDVIEVKPQACTCGQTEFPDTRPYYAHQVIEFPEIQMAVRHIVLHEARCPKCGRVMKAHVPTTASSYGYGPRLTALIGELSSSQPSRLRRHHCILRSEGPR